MSSTSILFPTLSVPHQSFVSNTNNSSNATWSSNGTGSAPYTPRTTPPALAPSPPQDYFSRRMSTYSYGADSNATATTNTMIPTPISPESKHGHVSSLSPTSMDADVAHNAHHGYPTLAHHHGLATGAPMLNPVLDIQTDSSGFPIVGDVEDWDSLPQILKQPVKKDGTPPRPMNAYFIFMRLRRPQIAAKEPSLTTGQISTQLGKEWASMDRDEKSRWNDMADRLLRAFKKKYPDYQYERSSSKKPKKGAMLGDRSVSRSHRGLGDGISAPTFERHLNVRSHPYAGQPYPVGPSSYAGQTSMLGHGYPQHIPAQYYYPPPQAVAPQGQMTGWNGYDYSYAQTAAHEVPRNVSATMSNNAYASYPMYAQPQTARHVSALYMSADHPPSSPEDYA